jgi:hypothetical protein
MDYPKQTQSWLNYIKHTAPEVYKKITEPTTTTVFSRNRCYALEEDGTIRPATDIFEANRQIGKSIVQTTVNENPEVYVSTVFLSLDHNHGFHRDARPILFETMIFGGQYDGECRRYPTLEEATTGHRLMVAHAQMGFIDNMFEGNND